MKSITRLGWRLFPFKRAIKRVYRSPAMPMHWGRARRVCRILNLEYGFLRTVAENRCVAADGSPIPWYTYPALEFVRQLDLSDRTVFEYGAGNSSLFWSSAAKRVVCVEHDREWSERMQAVAPTNCEIFLAQDADAYVNAIERGPTAYDVIVIDGQSRLRCAQVAPRYLREGGVIILDNSDWFPRTSEALREAGLLEVDMSGFGPINDYTSTTSFYFDRRFAFLPKQGRQPVPGIGSRPNSFDEAWWKLD